VSRSDHQRPRPRTFHGTSMEGHIAAHSAWDVIYGGTQGLARSIRGAKKFVNSRRRFHDRMALRRLQQRNFEE